MRLLVIPLALSIACTSSDSAVDDTGAATSTLPEAGTGLTGDTSCASAQLFPTLTAHAANSDYPDPFVGAACDGDTLVVEANGIPTFEFIAMTPNGLVEQYHHWEIDLTPEVAAATSEIPLLGTVAFSLTGLPIYGPNEADFPDPYGDPVYNDIVDSCLGHTGGTGDYHYHAMLVECILDGIDTSGTSQSPIIGFALDGFPIYGPFGCLDEPCTDVVEFSSGWTQIGDPTTYAWDANTFTPDSDDTTLDECNGRIGPDGTYRYHATSDFPYLLGCYAGTANGAGDGAPGDDGGDGGGGPGNDPIECVDAPPGAPCCGDDICDGPETVDNCAVDCE